MLNLIPIYKFSMQSESFLFIERNFKIFRSETLSMPHLTNDFLLLIYCMKKYECTMKYLNLTVSLIWSSVHFLECEEEEAKNKKNNEKILCEKTLSWVESVITYTSTWYWIMKASIDGYIWIRLSYWIEALRTQLRHAHMKMRVCWLNSILTFLSYYFLLHSITI
jgi:hypothetical protein